MTKVVAFVPDLMDRSRLGGVPNIVFVARSEDLVEAGADADVVVLDLSRPGALDVLPALGSTRTVGFGEHVDRGLLERARAAGCGTVVARSEFFRRVQELLA